MSDEYVCPDCSAVLVPMGRDLICTAYGYTDDDDTPRGAR